MAPRNTRADIRPQQSRSGVLTQDLMTADLDLRRRDRELSEIAKSIAQLAELFKDLSALVIDQGTLLDSVEYNIEQTAVQMSEAVKELNMATQYVLSAIGPTTLTYFYGNRYQKNTGRRKCIFLLLLVIFGLILVLIFKPRRHHTPPPDTQLSSNSTFSAAPFAQPTEALRRRPSG